MARLFKWVAIALALLVLLLAGVVFALHQWLGTDDFRQRVEREGSAALGVPLTVGTLAIDVWPLPAVAAAGVRIASQPPITLQRVEARPVWSGLLQGELRISTLLVREAVLPQAALLALAAAPQKKPVPPGKAAEPADIGATLAMLPRRVVLDRVTWVDGKGQPMTVDARLQLDDGGLESASFKVLQGRLAGTRGSVERRADHWPVRVDIGGGTIVGSLRLQPGKDAARVLSGELDTSGVEVSALTAPSRTLTGQLEAKTTLRAAFRDPAQLADVLATSTRFTVRNAVLHGLDLVQAAKTVGLSRGGATRLDTLVGQVTTQGRSVQLSNLVATSGSLAATGNIAMAANQSLSGRVTVELASTKGSVGVPLVVGGTVDAPSVTLSRAALLGAAVGTLLAPGAGTAAGASAGDKIGDKLKGLFGR